EGERRRAKDRQRSRIPEELSRTLCGAADTRPARCVCRIFGQAFGQMGRGNPQGAREDRMSAAVPADAHGTSTLRAELPRSVNTDPSCLLLLLERELTNHGHANSGGRSASKRTAHSPSLVVCPEN